MKSFKKLLTELFDNPLPWEWGDSSKTRKIAFFNTEENEYRVMFSFTKVLKAEGKREFWDIMYESKDEQGRFSPFEVTNEHKANEVLATTLEIIESFIKNENPEEIEFDAEKNDLGRSNIYQKMLEKKLPSNYELEIRDIGDEDTFRIKRKNK